MGAWATDAFGNDDACDWAADLISADTLGPIERTFSKIAAVGDDYLEAPDAAEGIAAAEVVARLRGNFGERNAYTEDVDAWVARMTIKPDAALCQRAHAVIDRVLSEPSELLELWQESEEFDAWEQAVLDIKGRISV